MMEDYSFYLVRIPLLVLGAVLFCLSFGVYMVDVMGSWAPPAGRTHQLHKQQQQQQTELPQQQQQQRKQKPEPSQQQQQQQQQQYKQQRRGTYLNKQTFPPPRYGSPSPTL